jgi:hypothetical protein
MDFDKITIHTKPLLSPEEDEQIRNAWNKWRNTTFTFTFRFDPTAPAPTNEPNAIDSTATILPLDDEMPKEREQLL